jgi:hypothetical protein
MNVFSRWRWQLGTPDERAQCCVGPPNPAGVRTEATAEVPLVPQQAVGGVAFPVVPDLLWRIELQRVGGELFHMQPRVGVPDRGERRPLMDRALSPPEDDVPPQMTQDRPQEVSHVDRLEMAGLEADIETHGPALGGHGERGQCRDPLMLVVVTDDERVPLGCPGAAASRHEQKAAFIQEGQVGSQAAGFLLSPATCHASTGRRPVRCVGWAAVPAPDNASPRGARLSKGAPGDSASHTAPEARPRCASGSTVRWRSHVPWAPGATAGATACPAGLATCAAARARAWGPRPPRLRSARLAASERLSPPTLAAGAPLRSGSSLPPAARWPGVGAFLTFGVLHRVSCRIC